MRISSATMLIAALALSVPHSALAGPGKGGSSISASKTVHVEREKRGEYDWEVDKSVKERSVEIEQGETATLHYEIRASRGPLKNEAQVFAFSGEVCVTNSGSAATRDLKIVDQLQCRRLDGGWGDVPGAADTITPAEELEAGETKCYGYEFALPVNRFVPTCRNQATVSVSNDVEGDPMHSVVVHAPVVFPSEPTKSVVLDREATLTDAVSCPAGFTCTPSSSGPWTFAANGAVEFTVTVRNDSVECGSSFDLTNVAKLVEKDTAQERTDAAKVVINTGRCTPPGQQGCTLTIGYWKNHAGGQGNNADEVTPKLPISLGLPVAPKSLFVSTAQIAKDVLAQNVYGSPSNGITKLYAQLLAAKLNIANGANGSAVAVTIAQADGFLATHDFTSWDSLTAAEKALVNGWHASLDDYNNGRVGPGHCER